MYEANHNQRPAQAISKDPQKDNHQYDKLQHRNAWRECNPPRNHMDRFPNSLQYHRTVTNV